MIPLNVITAFVAERFQEGVGGADQLKSHGSPKTGSSRRKDRVRKTEPQYAPLCVFACLKNQRLFVGGTKVTVRERITSCQTFSGGPSVEGGLEGWGGSLSFYLS